jgi:hypothetical protein
MIHSRSPSRCGLALVALGCLVASEARADATSEALARTLFDEGRVLMAAGSKPEACAKFAESMRLDAKTGTLLNLAVCHEDEGRTATAWVEFRNALSMARRDGRADREQLAAEHIAALEPRLSRITITVDSASDLPGLEVQLNGVAVGKPVWGSAMPVDPGKHTITALAPGRARWETRIDVGPNADKQIVPVPLLEIQTTASPATKAAATPATSHADVTAPDTGISRRTMAYVSGAAGLVMLGMGAYFGVQASTKWKEAKQDHCPGGVCDSQAPQLSRDANTAAWVSNVGIGLGVVGLGLGAHLMLSDSKQPSAGQAARSAPLLLAPILSQHGGGIAARAVW